MSGCACFTAISAPGATSSQDLDLVQSQRVTPRSLPVPNPHHVVARTLARPRQIVTMIVTERHKFVPSPPFGVGRSPHNWSDREIRGAAATQYLPRESVKRRRRFARSSGESGPLLPRLLTRGKV